MIDQEQEERYLNTPSHAFPLLLSAEEVETLTGFLGEIIEDEATVEVSRSVLSTLYQKLINLDPEVDAVEIEG